MLCREDRISGTFNHRMWGMKSWEASQITGLGGGASKQDAGRSSGLRVGGNFRVSSTELSGTLLKASQGGRGVGHGGVLWATPSTKGRVTMRVSECGDGSGACGDVLKF